MADHRYFPRWNSADRSVIETAVTEDGGEGSTPCNATFPRAAPRTSSRSCSVTGRPNSCQNDHRPTRFAYDIEFTPANGGTVVKLNARAELGRIGKLIGLKKDPERPPSG